MTKRGGFLSFLNRHPSAVVVMDNSTVHNKARTPFKDNGVRMLDWPPKSPDMTPIKNLWSILDVIKCRKNTLNCDLLKESITASYSELLSEVGFVERTSKSVSNRMRIVIEEGALWVLGSSAQFYAKKVKFQWLNGSAARMIACR